MSRTKSNKGAALFIVLGIVLIVFILTQVIIGFIFSHARVTHHEISRIQAYYAAKAGTILALENLRSGAWTFDPNSCLDPSGQLVADTDFPPSIQSVRVIFCPADTTCVGSGESLPCNPPAGSGINFCIQTTANYTYTSP